MTCPEVIVSLEPTSAPTNAPSRSPSMPPTAAPSDAPSVSPTEAPTITPTTAPTYYPVTHPTNAPTITPTAIPTDAPVPSPTVTPSKQPTDEESELTERDIQTGMTWTLVTIGILAVIIFLLGIYDSKYWRRNDLFDRPAIFVFIFYVTDFVSGLVSISLV